MRPLAALDQERAARVEVVLFDLDDTLLTHGVLTREAYGALWDLSEAGLSLVAVTGRPAGWADVLARQWPVAGVIAENGAIAVGKRAPILGPTPERPFEVVERVRAARFPHVRYADDNAARRTDVTLDVGEHAHLDLPTIEALRGALVAEGLRVTVSSVHLHGTRSGDDKASGALHFLRGLGIDAGAARARAVFVGDSGNDAACFAAFPLSVGVDNVRAWVPRLSVPPAFVTEGARGAGFVELAETLLRARPRRTAGP